MRKATPIAVLIILLLLNIVPYFTTSDFPARDLPQTAGFPASFYSTGGDFDPPREGLAASGLLIDLVVLIGVPLILYWLLKRKRIKGEVVDEEKKE